MTGIRAHMLENPEAFDVALLADRLADSVVLTHGPDVPGDIQILIAGRPLREHLAIPSLETLIIPWVGVPTRTRDFLADFPNLAVHNLHHNAPIVAEFTMALLLAAAKHVVPLDRRLRNGDWTSREASRQSLLLAGKTCLILGYGEIGRRVARLCRAFDMKIVAVRSQAQEPDGLADEIHGLDSLDTLLPRTDVVVVALPLTAETRGLIGERELDLLPDTAVLVNVGRGPIIDEAALFEALRDRRIAGAGLDVWYNYPKDEEATAPSDFPFGDLDNVVMSPHRGGGVAETEQLRADALAAMLEAAVRGEPLPNRVDLERGY